MDMLNVNFIEPETNFVVIQTDKLKLIIGRNEKRPNWWRRFWYWFLLDWKWEEVK